ncbi:hypothetical protein H6P81_004060 [Aristolochia fimbriata]|uniref:Neprosin PEP catalytic domain-containing protein n=1 Tax=Aristolochia fimbriata TaxID=158543 RepID=A0AAV7FH56_ARIFI|nr:hypothetical protein H6P81_004060 [Aristolochia fimbriata]
MGLMAPTLRTLTLVCIALCMSLYGTTAECLSTEKFLEMKRHLRSLNKPAVKSIQILEPSSCVSSNETRHILELPDGGCPEGTVPIRRVQMQDLLRAPSLSTFGKKLYAANSSFGSLAQSSNNIQYRWAKIDSKNGDLYGTHAHINLWTPYVKGKDKYSSAQVWLFSGLMINSTSFKPDGLYVSEELFGNAEPRFYIYWTVDRYISTGCYNTLCPGFVSVHPRIPLGRTFRQMSSPGGDQFFVRVKIVKERLDWWLYVNEEKIGFWPQRIFNHINEKAERASWGGEVFSVQGVEFPPMGSGAVAAEGFAQAAFVKSMQLVNGDGQYYEAPTDTKRVVDTRCYSLASDGVNEDPNWRRYFYFGGPGGRC